MKAVLVIDMLEDFFAGGPCKSMRVDLTDRINTLTSSARRHGVPVIWVRQEFQEDLADAFAAMRRKNIQITIAGTPGCGILGELQRAESDDEIIKKRYSAFFRTKLEDVLAQRGVKRVLLAGVNTHACVRMTAVDAYQRDLEVTILGDCVASYDMEHHAVTLRYLARDIAEVANLDEIEW